MTRWKHCWIFCSVSALSSCSFGRPSKYKELIKRCPSDKIMAINKKLNNHKAIKLRNKYLKYFKINLEKICSAGSDHCHIHFDALSSIVTPLPLKITIWISFLFFTVVNPSVDNKFPSLYDIFIPDVDLEDYLFAEWRVFDWLTDWCTVLTGLQLQQ